MEIIEIECLEKLGEKSEVLVHYRYLDDPFVIVSMDKIDYRVEIFISYNLDFQFAVIIKNDKSILLHIGIKSLFLYRQIF